MDIRIKNICKDIQNGRLLEESIPQLFNYLADQYQVMAQVRLAMHYYTLYESYYDDEDTWSREAVEEIDKINQILKDSVLHAQSGKERETAVHKIDTIRNSIMKRMNILTTYTDIFQNYEYVLNRVEYRFANEAASTDDIELSREILRYIFDTEDNLVINEKIKEIISQLPMRLTRQKYFEVLKESLGVYLGADNTSLDTFLYMLRTSAMLYREDGMESLYPSLWEKKEYLSGLDYANISKEEYEKAVSTLQAATLILETATSVWYGLQEIINEIYAILLCSPYSGMAENSREKAQAAAIAIIRGINDIYIQNIKIEPSDALLLNNFAILEGVQEELSYDMESLEYALYEAEQNYKALIEGLMLDQFMNVLKRTRDLLSNSLFIDFEEKTVSTVVDEARIEKEANALENELKELFAGHDRMISRAVMANTINKVPVFFKNHKEVMDYVIYSLERCSDRYEKAACAEIINELISH